MTDQTDSPFADTAQHPDPVSAPAEQREQLHTLARALAHEVGEVEGAGAHLLRLPSGQEVALPAVIVTLLAHIAEVLARGDAVIVTPVAQVLPIWRAAALLGVSSAHLTRLLDDGRIPSHDREARRRVRLDDLLAFSRKSDAQRRAALDELVRLTEAFRGYDDELGQGRG